MVSWTHLCLLSVLVAAVVAPPSEDYWKDLEEIFGDGDEEPVTQEPEMCPCSYTCEAYVPEVLESAIPGQSLGGLWAGCGLHRPPVPGRSWPLPKIPLEIADEFNFTSIRGLKNGVELLEKATCLKFVNVTHRDEPYVRIVPGKGGCNA
ncbi:hypothetical protein Pmani_030621 [Petrolisthes manimaculis]|uniref:Peptidase M12A domain-containing protein n=1 Tax=Petrolisthes manimaculis TaxID=1843537 RepID=A0AAE1NWB3_9EUCA|nr:hypothetical protein Pmani_030621 [Petrolisthes manimaculis]